jgi:hypothetical protein
VWGGCVCVRALGAGVGGWVTERASMSHTNSSAGANIRPTAPPPPDSRPPTPAHARCSIDVREGGVDSLIELGEGDMRRTLNLLQSTFMSSGHVSREAVYSCAGKPLPRDIEDCAQWLLNEPLASAYKREWGGGGGGGGGSKGMGCGAEPALLVAALGTVWEAIGQPRKLPCCPSLTSLVGSIQACSSCNAPEG